MLRGWQSAAQLQFCCLANSQQSLSRQFGED